MSSEVSERAERPNKRAEERMAQYSTRRIHSHPTHCGASKDMTRRMHLTAVYPALFLHAQIKFSLLLQQLSNLFPFSQPLIHISTLTTKACPLGQIYSKRGNMKWSRSLWLKLESPSVCQSTKVRRQPRRQLLMKMK